uniref:Gag-pol protein n=1 Tax=Solanum tuberosum TaxID=4113 RepID=M1DFX3_SOLTU
MKPTLPTIHQILSTATIDISSKIRSKDKSFPLGTVLIKRFTKEDLIRQRNMPPPEDFKSESQLDDTWVNPGPDGMYERAIVHTQDNPENKFSGAGMITTVWNVDVQCQQNSTYKMKIQRGSDKLQVGWRVDPTLYGDNDPRLFIHYQRTPKLLVKTFEVSTPIGESIIARRVYHNCIVTICDRDTLADLVELQMVDFDVIMGMNWLASCYAMVDCRTKMVHFYFPKEAVLEWKGNIGAPRGKFISYLKAKKMISKGYICHLVRVKNIDAEPPTLQSIPVVNEFPEDLPGLPPKREVDFGIDAIPDTQPISIPPNRMAPTELRELKEQLKNLLEKGFIRPSMSPWGAPILFVRKKDGSL